MKSEPEGLRTDMYDDVRARDSEGWKMAADLEGFARR
jgi:hypothetical protein